MARQTINVGATGTKFQASTGSVCINP